MADKSAIEWTDATWTPIRARNKKTGAVGWHCEHATTGCEFCYAENFNRRLGTGLPFKPGHRADIELFLDETMLLQPLRWKRPRKVFVGSMTDIFAAFVPDEWLDRMFAVMALAPQHTFQVLTKRAERMHTYVAEPGRGAYVAGASVADTIAIPVRWPLSNVWLGVSAERQPEADERILHLLATPAAVRFVSAEPLLGPINLTSLAFSKTCGCEHRSPTLNAFEATVLCEGCCEGPERLDLGKLDWVIVGGESGPSARPVHPGWVRSLREQCAAAGVAFYFKQWGEWLPWTQFSGARIHDDPEQTRFSTKEWDGGHWSDAGHPMWCDSIDGQIDDRQCVGLVGKKAAGRVLDGETHSEFPAGRDPA
jgi:protein gp37